MRSLAGSVYARNQRRIVGARFGKRLPEMVKVTQLESNAVLSCQLLVGFQLPQGRLKAGVQGNLELVDLLPKALRDSMEQETVGHKPYPVAYTGFPDGIDHVRQLRVKQRFTA